MARSCDRAVFDNGELAVILGDGATARLYALALRMLCGVDTVICDTQKSGFRFVFPFGSFYSLTHSDQPRILFEELCHISSLGRGTLMFLAVGGKRYGELIQQIRDDIESRFIISDLKGIIQDRIF